MKTIAPSQVIQAVTPGIESESPPEAPPIEIRILKVASCPSLSGQSTLTYHVGCTASSQIVFRVFGNSGGGYFSNEWIDLHAIDQAFSEVPNGIAITAHVLVSLFQGKSANSTGFLFAVLKHEGLVRSMKDKKSSYERTDAIAFMDDVKQLIDSAVDLKVEDKLVKATPPQIKEEEGKERAKPDAPSDANPISEAKSIPDPKPAKAKPRGAR